MLRHLGRLPVAAKAALTALILLAAYLPVVALMESREEARIEALRATDPAAYLDAVRAHGGMAPYLEALAEVRHFDDWRDTAPNFLIGAWALRAADAAPDADHPPADPAGACLSGIVIEDRGIRWFGARPRKVAAQYRIEDEHVLVRLAEGGIAAIDVAAQGSREIEITMPGSDRPAHGFRCG